MSALDTLSTFYYGFLVTKDNQYLDFDEGSGPIFTTLKIGDYTFEEFCTELQNALNLVGALTYTVTKNRATRMITISATGNFSLLCASGSHIGTGIFTLVGFTGSDKTGLNSYTGNQASGYEYRPQMILKNYIKPEDYEVKETAVVSMSANGQVQTVSFGEGQRMQCNIIGASNLTGLKNYQYYENSNGVENLRHFLRYLITKSKVEFMPDVDARASYYNLLLESTRASRDGTQYRIENMDGTKNYYETGDLVFRKVIS